MKNILLRQNSNISGISFGLFTRCLCLVTISLFALSFSSSAVPPRPTYRIIDNLHSNSAREPKENSIFSRFAMYNVNKNGDGFASSHKQEDNGYFAWDEAIHRFGASLYLPLNGYYLPDYSSLSRVGSLGFYWSSTEYDYDSLLAYHLYFNSSGVYVNGYNGSSYKKCRFSVRLILAD